MYFSEDTKLEAVSNYIYKSVFNIEEYQKSHCSLNEYKFSGKSIKQIRDFMFHIDGTRVLLNPNIEVAYILDKPILPENIYSLRNNMNKLITLKEYHDMTGYGMLIFKNNIKLDTSNAKVIINTKFMVLVIPDLKLKDDDELLIWRIPYNERTVAENDIHCTMPFISFDSTGTMITPDKFSISNTNIIHFNETGLKEIYFMSGIRVFMVNNNNKGYYKFPKMLSSDSVYLIINGHLSKSFTNKHNYMFKIENFNASNNYCFFVFHNEFIKIPLTNDTVESYNNTNYTEDIIESYKTDGYIPNKIKDYKTFDINYYLTLYNFMLKNSQRLDYINYIFQDILTYDVDFLKYFIDNYYPKLIDYRDYTVDENFFNIRRRTSPINDIPLCIETFTENMIMLGFSTLNKSSKSFNIFINGELFIPAKYYINDDIIYAYVPERLIKLNDTIETEIYLDNKFDDILLSKNDITGINIGDNCKVIAPINVTNNTIFTNNIPSGYTVTVNTGTYNLNNTNTIDLSVYYKILTKIGDNKIKDDAITDNSISIPRWIELHHPNITIINEHTLTFEIKMDNSENINNFDTVNFIYSNFCIKSNNIIDIFNIDKKSNDTIALSKTLEYNMLDDDDNRFETYIDGRYYSEYNKYLSIKFPSKFNTIRKIKVTAGFNTGTEDNNISVYYKGRTIYGYKTKTIYTCDTLRHDGIICIDNLNHPLSLKFIKVYVDRKKIPQNKLEILSNNMLKLNWDNCADVIVKEVCGVDEDFKNISSNYSSNTKNSVLNNLFIDLVNEISIDDINNIKNNKKIRLDKFKFIKESIDIILNHTIYNKSYTYNKHVIDSLYVELMETLQYKLNCQFGPLNITDNNNKYILNEFARLYSLILLNNNGILMIDPQHEINKEIADLIIPTHSKGKVQMYDPNEQILNIVSGTVTKHDKNDKPVTPSPA